MKINISNLYEMILEKKYNNKLKDLSFKFEYLLRYFFQYENKKDIKINELLNVFCNQYNTKDKVHDFLNLFQELIDFIISLNDDNERYLFLFKHTKIIIGQLFYCHKESPEMYNYFESIIYSYLIRRNICEYNSKGITSVIPTLIPDIVNQQDNANGLNIDEIKSFFKKQIAKNAAFPNNKELNKKILTTNFYAKKYMYANIMIN